MWTALTTLLVGLVVLLWVPVDVIFSIQRTDKLKGRVVIAWLFGLVRIPVHFTSVARKPASPKSRGSVRARAHRVRRRRRAHPWAMLRSEGFIRRAGRLFRRLLALVHIRRLHLRMRLGLDDPADTGRLWGVIGSVAWMVPAGADVDIEPEFSGETFGVDGEGAVRIVPIEILATLMAFALSPITWRALRALRTGS